VFSAERAETERAVPAAALVAEPAPQPQPTAMSAPAEDPLPEPESERAAEAEDLAELDGIDDLVSAPPPAEPLPEHSEPSRPELAAEPAGEEPESKRKRRFWPFGRR
jgi:hypothetical protein